STAQVRKVCSGDGCTEESRRGTGRPWWIGGDQCYRHPLKKGSRPRKALWVRNDGGRVSLRGAFSCEQSAAVCDAAIPGHKYMQALGCSPPLRLLRCARNDR